MPQQVTSLNRDPLFKQAVALHQAGRLAEAATLYRQLLETFPMHPNVLNGLGSLALQQGNFEDGVRLLELSLQVLPNQPLVLCNCAIGLRNLGRLDASLDYYDRAIAAKHDLADAHSNRALTLFDLGRWEEALAS